jgi:hypothetical protein
MGFEFSPGSVQGVPDLNIVANLPSVSGYASIVNANYQTATQTHAQGNLNVDALTAGELDRLDLREMITLPEYFLVPLQSAPTSVSEVVRQASGFRANAVLPHGFGTSFNGVQYAFARARPALSEGKSAAWYFGGPTTPESATLVFTRAASAGAIVRLGTVGSNRSVSWLAPVAVQAGDTSVTEHLPSSAAEGLSVQVVSGSLPSQTAVITDGGQAYELSGSLSSIVEPQTWSVVGTSEGYVVYLMRKPPVPITAEAASGRTIPVRVLSSTTKSEQVEVDAPVPVDVIRSVAWDSGWTASVAVNGGPSRTARVGSVDLVQVVHAPSGRVVVTFHYRPPHLTVATVFSVGALAFLGVLAVGAAASTFRRRRREQPESSSDDATQDARSSADLVERSAERVGQ